MVSKWYQSKKIDPTNTVKPALQYIGLMTSKKVIGSIFFLQKKRNLHYHKVNDNHDTIGDSPYE